MKWIFLLLVLAGLLFSSSGTTTMQWPNTAYFIFATQELTSYDEIKDLEMDPTMVFDISLEPWNEPGWCTNYIDMGTVSLDSLTDPPMSGYNDDVMGFADCAYVEEGHAYWIKTRNDNFAKVKITEAVHVGIDPEHGHINRISFDWVFFGDDRTGGTSGDPVHGETTTSYGCFSMFIILITAGLMFIVKRR